MTVRPFTKFLRFFCFKKAQIKLVLTNDVHWFPETFHYSAETESQAEPIPQHDMQ